MGAHSVEHYWKVYLTLVGLFLVSFFGPFIAELLPHGHVRTLFVLFVAFGVAVWKASLVAVHFMHVNIEQRFMHYALITALVFMLMFVAGVSPDVMNHHGERWENVAAKAEIERALAEGEAGHGHGEHHDEGAEHGAEAAGH